MADKYIISRAAVLRADVVYAAAIPDHLDSTPTATRICQYVRGAWDTVDVRAGTAWIARYDRPEGGRIAVYVSPQGRAFSPEPSFVQGDVIDASLQTRKKLGYLTCCRQIGGDLVACGHGGVNYRRRPDGTWAPLDLAMFDDAIDRNWVYEVEAPGATMGEQDAWWASHPRERAEQDRRAALLAVDLSLYAVDGSGPRDVYMCSAGGDIYHFDGDRARKIPSPVATFLNGILVQDADTVWICGHGGTLLRGNARDGFTLMPCIGQPDFNALARFQDRLYLSSFSSPKGVFVYDGTRLRQVTNGPRGGFTDVNMIDAVEDALWVFGLRSMARFDGTSWERIPVPV